MFFLTIISDYLYWHYTTALTGFVRLYKNFWWFLVQFFSLHQLLSSLFTPYKRMTEPRGASLSLSAWFSYLVINTVSRLLGFIIRITIICTGLLSLIGLLIVSLIGYGIWLAAPVIIVYCFSYGVFLLFT